MVSSIIFPATFYTEHIPGFRYNTDRCMVAGSAGTNRTDIILCKILANTAAMHTAFGRNNCISKASGFRFRQTEYMEGSALRTLSANAGQGRKLVNQIFKRCGEKRHGLLLVYLLFLIASMAAERSALPKTALPATRTSAPASMHSAAVTASTPPSTSSSTFTALLSI